jgi:hypothetical protein
MRSVGFYIKKNNKFIRNNISFYTIELIRIIPCWQNNIFLDCTLRIIFQKLMTLTTLFFYFLVKKNQVLFIIK